jgi:NTP pyrophosphatase (non-canonical NTP hydrolase)
MMTPMTARRTLAELVAINRTVAAAFEQVERRPWSIEVTALELAKQVGDLSRRILSAEGYYLPDRDHRPEYAGQIDDIGDELADILYCLIRISDHYGVDLEAAHLQARRDELQYLGHEPNF